MNCSNSIKVKTITHPVLTGEIVNFAPAVSAIAEEILGGFGNTGDFLPLSGGILTGDLYVPSLSTSLIHFDNGGYVYGNGGELMISSDLGSGTTINSNSYTLLQWSLSSYPVYGGMSPGNWFWIDQGGINIQFNTEGGPNPAWSFDLEGALNLPYDIGSIKKDGIILSDNWNNVYSTVSANSATWGMGGSGGFSEKDILLRAFYAEQTADGSDGTESFNGTWDGTPAYIACGYNGYSFDFDGTNKVIVSDPSINFGTKQWSIMAWFSTTSSDMNRGIIGGDSGNTDFYGVLLDTSGHIGLDTASAIYLGSTGGFNDGAWHQVIVTSDGTLIRLYVDGNLDLEISYVPWNNTGISIGSYSTMDGWIGRIDHVKFFSAVLSTQQIVDSSGGNIIVVSPSSVDLAGLGIRRLAEPVTGDDAATKNYVDGKDKVKIVNKQTWSDQYRAVVEDLNGTLLTDTGNTDYCIIRLPLLEMASRHGGIIRVIATREPSYEYDYTNMIGIYANEREYSGNVFYQGPDDNNKYSLWSSNKGDYIELVPFYDGTNFVWRVLNVRGWWEDRD